MLTVSGGRRAKRLAPDPCFRFDSPQVEGGRLRTGVVVPEGCPLFEGHFPGHPILPAIGHLALLAEALARGHVEGSLAEVPALRLRHPVGPGERLDLVADLPISDRTVRFELSRGGEPVSHGTVRLARPSHEGSSPVHPAAPDPSDRPVAETGFGGSLLAHASPARFVEGIVEAGEQRIVCAASVPENHPLVRRGVAPGYAALEAAAQAAAVLEALQRRAAAGAPRLGYLVGIRDARFAAELPAGRLLRVTARLTASMLPLSRYEVGIELDGAAQAAATISTYLVEKP